MNKHDKCIVCNSKKLKKLNKYYDQKGLIKCKNCGFVFMEKIPTESELNNYYSSYAYEGEQYLSPLTIESYNTTLDEFEKYRKTNNLLDVGCGRGFFLEEAKKRGWNVFGTEYSDTAIKLLQSKGITTFQGQISDYNLPVNEFDVITSFEVIEHINNPNEDLKAINQLMRKGGLFYCTTPNFNSLMRYYLKTDYNVIHYPEHLSYYTKKTLNKVVEQNGFKNIKFLSTGISLTRIKTSKNTSDEKMVEENNSDELLRQKMSSKSYLRFSKKSVNKLFTVLNLGLTLKGYYEKN